MGQEQQILHSPLYGGICQPSTSPPMVTKALMIIPNLRLPLKLIITPRIQKISTSTHGSHLKNFALSLNLGEYQSPPTPQEIGLLQGNLYNDGCGAMLVGSLLGAGIASSVISHIKADLTDIRSLTEQQILAINTLSDGLPNTHKVIIGLHWEIKLLKQSLVYNNKYTAGNGRD